MEINKHISFSLDDGPELFTYLQNNNIPYEIVMHMCVFDIYESNPHWKNISRMLKQSKALWLSNTIFTKKELSDAQWLTVRSVWRNGYPQPEDDFSYESITYCDEKCCQKCGSGLYQQDDFRIRKAVNWGKRHFMMLNWVEDELFVDDIARNILEKEKITGVSFRSVKNKKGTEIIPNINQLVISTVLPKGIFTDNRAIRDINMCSSCGVTKYLPTGIGRFQFDRRIFENAPDIVWTDEVFGSGSIASHEIIVNQKVYQTIIQNHLESSLKFQPIELI